MEYVDKEVVRCHSHGLTKPAAIRGLTTLATLGFMLVRTSPPHALTINPAHHLQLVTYHPRTVILPAHSQCVPYPGATISERYIIATPQEPGAREVMAKEIDES